MSEFIKQQLAKQKADKSNLQDKLKSETSVQPEGKTEHLNNWDRHFSGMPQERIEALDFGSDELNSVFKNALNGQYKAFITKKELTGEIPEKFKNLGETAWELAKAAKHGTRDQVMKFKTDFHKYAEEAHSSVYANGDNYDMVWDEDTQKVVSLKDSPKHKEATIYRDKVGTDIQVKTRTKGIGDYLWAAWEIGKGGMGIGTDYDALSNVLSLIELKTDKKAAYKKIAYSMPQDMRDKLTSAYTPIVSSWLDYGFANWNNDKFASETEKYDNRENIVSLGTTALTHIAKYGSVNQVAQRDAKALLKELESISDVVTRQQFFKTKEADIRDLVEGMGYYGKKSLLKTHEDKFQSLDYYPGKTSEEKKKAMDSYFNVVKTYSEHQEKSDEVLSQLKNKAQKEFMLANKKDHVVNQMVGRTMFSEDGRLLSFADVKKKLEADSYVKDGVRYFKSKLWVPETSTYVQGSTLGMGTGGQMVKTGGGFKEYSYTQLKDAYDETVDKYKSQFNELRSDEMFRNSILQTGMGYNRSQMIGHNDINFKEDSKKNRNAHLIKKMVDSGIGSNQVLVKPGDYSHAVKPEFFEGVSTESQRKLFDSFLNNEQEYDVSFSRVTPLKEKSAYIFTTKGKNPKSVTFYVNTDYAEEMGEEYAKNTYTSPEEYAFMNNGKWELKSWNNTFDYAKDLQIIRKDGRKYLEGSFSDSSGQPAKKIKIFLGPDRSLRVDDAENLAREILEIREAEIKNYVNQ